MRALFFGLGGVGQRHLRNLKMLRPQVEIAAVRHSQRVFEVGNDLKADSSTNIEKKYDIQVMTSFEEGLKFKPDLAVVANPSSLHVETVANLVENGIPVFVEKPLVTSREGLMRLTDLTARKQVPVMVAYQMRFHPCVIRLKELLDQKKIGPISSVEISIHSYMPAWHEYEKPEEFYAGKNSLGGGVVLTEIHEIDLLSWFFDSTKKVMAFGGTLGPYALDVEDTVGAVLECESGGRTFPVSLMMSFMQKPPTRRLVVNGAEGRLILELPRFTLTHVLADGTVGECFQLPENFDRNNFYIDELAHFLQCLEEGSKPLTSLPEILDGEKVALAIKESLSTGKVVSLV
ncbi:MAG: Gfo/Idh/MocA family oxidoreductase [Nitrospinae bacterium]|nr:Gfo/Idh/MocA family oxidoreductase [Nitrospinota bacterium]